MLSSFERMFPGSIPEVVRDADGDLAAAEEQGRLDEKGRPVASRWRRRLMGLSSRKSA